MHRNWAYFSSRSHKNTERHMEVVQLADNRKRLLVNKKCLESTPTSIISLCVIFILRTSLGSRKLLATTKKPMTVAKSATWEFKISNDFLVYEHALLAEKYYTRMQIKACENEWLRQCIGCLLTKGLGMNLKSWKPRSLRCRLSSADGWHPSLRPEGFANEEENTRSSLSGGHCVGKHVIIFRIFGQIQ